MTAPSSFIVMYKFLEYVRKSLAILDKDSSILESNWCHKMIEGYGWKTRWLCANPCRRGQSLCVEEG